MRVRSAKKKTATPMPPRQLPKMPQRPVVPPRRIIPPKGR